MKIFTLTLSLLAFVGVATAEMDYQMYHYDPYADITEVSITDIDSYITAEDAYKLRYRKMINASTRTSSNASELYTRARVARRLGHTSSLVKRHGETEYQNYNKRRTYTSSGNYSIYKKAMELCLEENNAEPGVCNPAMVQKYITRDKEVIKKSRYPLETKIAMAEFHKSVLDGIRYADENTKTQVKTGLQKGAMSPVALPYSRLKTQKSMIDFEYKRDPKCVYYGATGEHTCYHFNPHLINPDATSVYNVGQVLNGNTVVTDTMTDVVYYYDENGTLMEISSEE